MSDKDTLPRDISLKPQGPYVHAFASFFGKYEADVTARLIVTLMAKENQWRPFTLSEILLVGRWECQPDYADRILEGWECLLEYKWITQSDGKEFVVTDDFIKRCKERSDARKS